LYYPRQRAIVKREARFGLCGRGHVELDITQPIQYGMNANEQEAREGGAHRQN
jgi:hypothetical protein